MSTVRVKERERARACACVRERKFVCVPVSEKKRETFMGLEGFVITVSLFDVNGGSERERECARECTRSREEVKERECVFWDSLVPGSWAITKKDAGSSVLHIFSLLHAHIHMPHIRQKKGVSFVGRD